MDTRSNKERRVSLTSAFKVLWGGCLLPEISLETDAKAARTRPGSLNTRVPKRPAEVYQIGCQAQCCDITEMNGSQCSDIKEMHGCSDSKQRPYLCIPSTPPRATTTNSGPCTPVPGGPSSCTAPPTCGSTLCLSETLELRLILREWQRMARRTQQAGMTLRGAAETIQHHDSQQIPSHGMSENIPAEKKISLDMLDRYLERDERARLRRCVFQAWIRAAKIESTRMDKWFMSRSRTGLRLWAFETWMCHVVSSKCTTSGRQSTGSQTNEAMSQALGNNTMPLTTMPSKEQTDGTNNVQQLTSLVQRHITLSLSQEQRIHTLRTENARLTELLAASKEHVMNKTDLPKAFAPDQRLRVVRHDRKIQALEVGPSSDCGSIIPTAGLAPLEATVSRESEPINQTPAGPSPCAAWASRATWGGHAPETTVAPWHSQQKDGCVKLSAETQEQAQRVQHSAAKGAPGMLDGGHGEEGGGALLRMPQKARCLTASFAAQSKVSHSRWEYDETHLPAHTRKHNADAALPGSLTTSPSRHVGPLACPMQGAMCECRDECEQQLMESMRKWKEFLTND
jgi:hypothetical protein